MFTIEEHSIRGGFAAQVLEELALVHGRADRIRPIAIPDAFVPHGTRSELLRELRLDPIGLAAQVREGTRAPRRAGARRSHAAAPPGCRERGRPRFTFLPTSASG